MTTTRQMPVTLTPEETNAVLEALTSYSRINFDHARRTKSAAIRAYAEQKAVMARDLEAAIVRRLYVTTEKE